MVVKDLFCFHRKNKLGVQTTMERSVIYIINFDIILLAISKLINNILKTQSKVKVQPSTYKIII